MLKSFCLPRGQLASAACLGFFLGSGGLVGAYGPSFDALQSSAHLSVAAFGDGTSLNRAAKVGGTMLWRSECLSRRPHAVVVAGAALMALSAALLASARGASSAHFSVAAFGDGLSRRGRVAGLPHFAFFAGDVV